MNKNKISIFNYDFLAPILMTLILYYFFLTINIKQYYSVELLITVAVGALILVGYANKTKLYFKDQLEKKYEEGSANNYTVNYLNNYLNKISIRLAKNTIYLLVAFLACFISVFFNISVLQEISSIYFSVVLLLCVVNCIGIEYFKSKI